MDYPVATVLEIEDRYALVRIGSAACPRCRAGRGCGAGLFARSRPDRTLRARVAAGVAVAPGDRVTIALAGASLIRAALYSYGAPLAGMLLAAAFAQLGGGQGNDAFALLWVLAGLLLGGLAGAVLARRDGCIRSLTPVINGRAIPEPDFTSA